jgi:hypothetical protein
VKHNGISISGWLQVDVSARDGKSSNFVNKALF